MLARWAASLSSQELLGIPKPQDLWLSSTKAINSFCKRKEEEDASVETKHVNGPKEKVRNNNTCTLIQNAGDLHVCVYTPFSCAG